MPNIAKHKDNIVVAAMRLFRRQGYASTGLNQILQESSAPKGSLYHYFPGGKEQLGLAAVCHAGALMLEMFESVAAEAASPQAFVEGYCQTMAGWMEESDFQSGCPIATTMLEMAPHSPKFTEAGNRVMDAWIGVVAGAIGRESSSKDAKSQAQQLIALMEGALLLARIRQSTQPIHDIAQYWEWDNRCS